MKFDSNFVRSSVLALSITTTAVISEFKPAIADGITSIRVCNGEDTFRFDITAKITSSFQKVEFKAKFSRKFVNNLPLWLKTNGISSYRWNHLKTRWSSDGITSYSADYKVISNKLTNEDVLFSIHVIDKKGKRTYDVGGIKNMGAIAPGDCKNQSYE